MAETALILTRPEAQAKRFLASLSASARQAVFPVISPLIEIVALDARVDLEPSTAAIFTSANAVACAPDGQGRMAYCVGSTTTAAAKSKGWHAIQMGQNADALVTAMIERPVTGPLVHLSGTHRRGDIERRLRDAGLQVSTRELYDQRLLPLGAEAQSALQGPSILPLFSPRTAQHLLAEAETLSNSMIVAMSDAVAEPLRDTEVAALHILDAPSGTDMVDFIEKLCLRTSLP